jgi:hypothetical protein
MSSASLRLFCCIVAGVSLGLGSPGCSTGQTPQEKGEVVDSTSRTPTAPALGREEKGGQVSVAGLREQLGIGTSGQIRKVGGEIVAVDLRGTTVEDLSPLVGLPLKQLFLEQTRVADLTPLAGMPLEQLYLSGTQVRDLTPLAGMRLKELNLVGTPLSDITPLQEVGFETLWIPQTAVEDLTPLSGKEFMSLDLQDTPVSDLSPLAGNQALKRLHIGGTQVSDLNPLAGLQLQRLIFSPERITSGLDAIRTMESLEGLDVTFDGSSPVMTPTDFWRRYDAGEWASAAPVPIE